MQWLMLVVTFTIMALLQRLTRSSGIPLEAHATLALASSANSSAATSRAPRGSI